MKTRLLIIVGIMVIISVVTGLSFVNDSEDTKNPNKCWYQEDDGEIKPCMTDTKGWPMPQEGFCDETNNGPFCVDRKTFESQYVGGGSIDLDPDLSPSFAYDFVFRWNSILGFIPLVSGIIAITLLSIHFILKKKNIRSRPYITIISAAIMLFFGLQTLSGLATIVMFLQQESPWHILENMGLLVYPTISISLIGFGIVFLYKSQLIRKLIRK